MKIGSVMAAGEKSGNFVILINGNPVGIFLSLEEDPVWAVNSYVELAMILVYTYYRTRIFINGYHVLVTLSPSLMFSPFPPRQGVPSSRATQKTCGKRRRSVVSELSQLATTQLFINLVRHLKLVNKGLKLNRMSYYL